MTLREELFSLQDLDYKYFHEKLVPTVSSDLIIGVRLPIMREIAKRLAKEENTSFECKYYEELMIKGLVIGYKKCNIEQRLLDLKEFVPMINSWGVCDSCCSTYKFTNKNMNRVWDFITQYVNGSEYEVRFAVVMMMDYYINDEYVDDVIKHYSSIKRDEYYINMAIAWGLSFVYIKYPERVERLFISGELSNWVQNMAIQKIRESNRVDKEQKEYLKKYKRA